MRKHFLQTLLVVVLSVIGVSQCWANTTSPFTFVSYDSGYCGNSENPSISYNELNSTCCGTIDRYADDGGDGGCRMMLRNEGPGKNCVMNLFSYSRSVEPYTKVVLTYNYELRGYAYGSYQTSVLYKFDDETTAKTTKLFFGNNTPSDAGKKYRFVYLCTESGWNNVFGSTDFVFDNLTGISEKSISKYIMLVLSESHNQLTPNTNVATFRCTKADFAYTYRKIITFNGNGSTGGSMSAQNIDNKGNLITNAFARDGYVFTGWNTEANGTGTTYADGAEITATASDKGAITLYAQWKETPDLYPFSYVSHKSGACSSDINPTISYGGMNDSKYGSITVDSHGTYGYGVYMVIENTSGTKSGVMMLTSYTHKVEPYTKVVLTYDYQLAGYSSGQPQVSALYRFDDVETAKSTQVDFTHGFFNREGSEYRLAYAQNQASGWEVAEESYDFVFDNLTGTSAKDISKYLMLVLCEGQPANQVIHVENKAFFKCTDYDFAYTYRKIITFDGNGGSGSMAQQTIENSGNLITNAFTRTGYTFTGWNTQADGKGTPYADDAEITATADSKGPVTLYAQWTPITYNITYNVNEGSAITEHLTYTIETATFALPVPTKNGYDFDGWFTDEDCTKDKTTQIIQGSTGHKTFYAKWTPITYNITYNVNEGSEITEHLTYTIETPTFALPVPTKNGFTFGGWFTNEECTEGKTTQIIIGSIGNKTFYAKWTAIVYNITYNVNGGSEITEPKTYTIETATFDLPVPTKDGYTFGGWFTNEACTEGKTTQIIQGSTGNKTFYALWSENVVSDGSNKDNVTDAAAEVNTALNTLLAECEGGKAINLTINRTIYKDGYYNTLCLPFDMSATQIAATFGTYKELKQFQSATVQGIGSSRSIVIEVEDATTIEAGKAYLISFEKGTDLTTLTFNQVVVSTTKATDASGDLAYQGILAPFQLPYGDQNYLFLGEKNTLYWPINDGTFMKGFRAYFKVNTNPAQTPYRAGMRAAFGGRQTPTDLSPAVSGQEVRKLLEQGRVVIVNKGVKYNMNGATVQ